MARLKVRCKSNKPYLNEINNGQLTESKSDSQLISLTLDKVYEVVSSDGEYYRIVDDTDEDYLYPISMFEIV